MAREKTHGILQPRSTTSVHVRTAWQLPDGNSAKKNIFFSLWERRPRRSPLNKSTCGFGHRVRSSARKGREGTRNFIEKKWLRHGLFFFIHVFCQVSDSFTDSHFTSDCSTVGRFKEIVAPGLERSTARAAVRLMFPAWGAVIVRANVRTYVWWDEQVYWTLPGQSRRMGEDPQRSPGERTLLAPKSHLLLSIGDQQHCNACRGLPGQTTRVRFISFFLEVGHSCFFFMRGWRTSTPHKGNGRIS